jgi:c-di-GMP-related signal transduction protein
METLAYLARQPILNRNGKIFAYELLFRDSPLSESAVIHNGVQATAQVLENVLNNIGLSKLIGNHKAFVNCSREMLCDNLFCLLNPDRFVLEILETVTPDEAIIRVVEQYHKKGFQLALDDFVYTPETIEQWAPVFPYISYVKMDLVENTPKNRALAAAYFKAKGISILAEKVETEFDFQECLKEGYDFFQGFFFAKPELVTTRKMDSTTAAILDLLKKLKSESSLDEISRAFENYPELIHKLLSYLNSSNSFKKPLMTIQEALNQIGVDHLNHWLLLLLYARPEMGESPQSSPLFQNATHRARFLENLGKAIDPKSDFSAKAFIVGLMSRMDALFKMPFQNILPSLSVDKDIQEALLYKNGRLGLLLRLADAVELDLQREILACSKELALSPDLLTQCIHDAYIWIMDD